MMTFPTEWEHKKCSKPPTRLSREYSTLYTVLEYRPLHSKPSKPQLDLVDNVLCSHCIGQPVWFPRRTRHQKIWSFVSVGWSSPHDPYHTHFLCFRSSSHCSHLQATHISKGSPRKKRIDLLFTTSSTTEYILEHPALSQSLIHSSCYITQHQIKMMLPIPSNSIHFLWSSTSIHSQFPSKIASTGNQLIQLRQATRQRSRPNCPKPESSSQTSQAPGEHHGGKRLKAAGPIGKNWVDIYIYMYTYTYIWSTPREFCSFTCRQAGSSEADPLKL